MTRLFPTLVGVGLAVLFIVGLATGATGWLVWLDGAAALLAFATIASIADPRSPLAAGLLLGPIAAGVFALWVVGLGTGATAWLLWCTFAAALVVGLMAIGATVAALLEEGPVVRLPTPGELTRAEGGA